MPDLDSVRRLYPDPPPEAPRSRERARLALVEHIDRRSRRRALPRRRLALGGVGLAAAVGAAAIALVGIGNEAGIDASAAAVLRDAAARTLAQEQPPAGAALYSKSTNEYMNVRPEDGFSVLVPHIREIWLEDGRGILRTSNGPPRFLSSRDRQRWIAAGRPQLSEGRGSTDTIPLPEPSRLPSDPDALFAAIEDEARGHSEGTYRQMFTRVGDYLREANEGFAVLTSAQQAALYEVAARIPGIELIGPVTDPAGRKGVAVAMANRSDGLRHTLVIDPATGMLLSEEQRTLQNNFHGYPEGTVVGHSTLLERKILPAGAPRPRWAKLP